MAICPGLEEYNTPERRAAYAKACRARAAEYRAQGDLENEKFLLWIAGNYERDVDNR